MLCRIKYKRDLRDFLKGTIIGNAKSFIDIGSGVVIPFGSDMTIKTKNQAYAIAKGKTDAINERYRADKYGNLASIDTTKSNGVVVNIHISEKLLDAYEVKYGQMEAEEMLRRERERMGDTTGEGKGEFYSVNKVKPGVEELFNSNPELANIGTQKQYSQYLDTVFPNSQVKDIVYHGSNNKFDKFDKSKFGLNSGKDERAFYFTPDRKRAASYLSKGLDEIDEAIYYAELNNDTEDITRLQNFKKELVNIYPVILNIINPLIQNKITNQELSRKDVIEKAQKNNDSIIAEETKDFFVRDQLDKLIYENAPTSNNYIVFEPEQIHILGNKEDIQGFKNFIKNKPSSKVTPNDKIKTRLLEFCKNNGIKVEFVDNLMRKGYSINGIYNVLDKAITIANNDDAMDSLIEEISHSVEDGLGKDDPLIKRLYDLTSGVDFASELGEEYTKLYGDDTEAMHKEYIGKVIKEGVRKATATKQPGVIQRIVNRIIEKFKGLFKKANTKEFDKIKAEVEDIATQLGNRVLTGKNMNFGYGSVTSMQPAHPELFAVSKKQTKKTKTVIDKYARQVNVLNNRLKRLENAIRQNKESLLKYPNNENLKNRIAVLEKELQVAKTKLGDYAKTSDPDTIISLGNNLLEGVRAFIERFEQGKVNLSVDRADDLGYSRQVIDAFKLIPGTAELATELEVRLDKIGEKIAVQYTNELKGESEGDRTIDDLKELGKDIGSARGAFGALVDLPDVLARTIGLAIKRAQNFISTEQKKVESNIKTEVDLLKATQAKRGIEEKNMYDIFIQKYKGTTVLTKKYKTEFYEQIDTLFKDKNYEALNKLAYKDPKTQEWKPFNEKKYLNPNYTIIQKNADLKRFYEFYDKTIRAYQAKLPITAQKDFIPNIRRNMLEAIASSDRSFMAKLADGFKAVTGIQTYTVLDSDRINNDELYDDLVPLKYIQKLSAEEKTNNLGEALNKFAAFAISYEEMSDVLPKVRLLQRVIQKKQYLKTADPSSAIYGEYTNLNKMINTVIDMQVKGKKKKDQGYIKMGDVKDDDGNVIGEKYKLASDVIDFGLTYNSILRIGLNPINALTNVLVGDIGNIVEGFGGRFYRVKDLSKATNIFFKENFADDSKLNKLLELINPLQELEDYSHSNQLKYTKKLSPEKLKEMMYSPQRAGEKFLQTRTMVAIMLKQTIKKADGSGEISLWEAFDKDGQLKKDYKDNFRTDKEYQEFLNKLTDKVQRVNQMIHGRYSERDAAAAQQNVLWRMAFQFKKWIPAAVEQRFGKEQYDVRLDTTIEGRYRTAWRLLGKALKGDIAALKAGNMTETEIYNMRKNFIELAITLGTVLMYFGLAWDDDDEKKRSPYYKLAMTTLDRVSGDMLFWMNPAEAGRTLKTPIPLIKTANDLLNVVYLTPFVFSEKNRYERGANKGELKLKVAIEKVIPAVNPFSSLISNWSDAKYQEPTNR